MSRKEFPDRVAMHGVLHSPDWEDPELVTQSDMKARPGQNTRNASEFLDKPETLRLKVKLIADLIRQSSAVCVYTGAGISTASGMPDYASRARESVAPHKAAKTKPKKTVNRLSLPPTTAHHAIAALEEKGFVHHWLQQNHDRLAQKAGFPQSKLNEIHGAWKDDLNPILMMSDSLRRDLAQWLNHWIQHADFCLALGTSLCGMNSDRVASKCAHRQRHNKPGQNGLAIVNLQRTSMDRLAVVRVWGFLDEVMLLLAEELEVTVPDRLCKTRGEEWCVSHPKCGFNTPIRTDDQQL